MDPSQFEVGYKIPVNKQIGLDTDIKAVILDISQNPLKFYVHYVNYNKRLDEWVTPDIFCSIDINCIEIPKKKNNNKTLESNKDEGTYRVKNVRFIQIEKYQIEAWYFSPYPKHIAAQPIIYICDFCLFYFGHLDQFNMHKEICTLHHPPGNEIYRKDELSFFELDGHVQKNYCRNLCLLSKLFLDHKTLYYDVDPFMFYLLCREDDDGHHLVGYFSKEKECTQGYNVACLLTMPHCQRKGYGRILIDFSYLLSRKEEMIASPEKPLSDLGLLSYKKYWKERVLGYLTKNKEKCVSVNQISKETSIIVADIIAVLSAEGSLKFYDGDLCFVLENWMEDKESVDEKYLEWIPTLKVAKME